MNDFQRFQGCLKNNNNNKRKKNRWSKADGSRGKIFLSWTELKLPVRAQDTGDWHRGLLRIGATFPVMWMLYRSAVERELSVKMKVSQDTLGSLSLYASWGTPPRCSPRSAWGRWLGRARDVWVSLLQRLPLKLDRWLGYSGNQIPEWPEMFTGQLQRGATSISFPVFTARLNVSHRYPAALKESSGIRPLCIISMFGYFLFFPGRSRVKSLNVTNFLWFLIAMSLQIASCVDAV